MEFSEVVRRRRMVRAYKNEAVAPEVVRSILETALRAPSAGFSQGQTYVVVTGAEERARIAESIGEADYVARGFPPWVSTAPVHIVVCIERARYEQRYSAPDKGASTPPHGWTVDYPLLDAGAGLMLLLLAAVDHGLAAGFMGAHRLLGIDALLDIPPDIEVVGLVTLGHPAPDRRPSSLERGRRPFEEVVRSERWGIRV